MEPFDPAKPNIARVWDYWLGVKDNFAADRELAGTHRDLHRRCGPQAVSRPPAAFSWGQARRPRLRPVPAAKGSTTIVR